MIELAETVFGSRTDPNQLNVDESVIERLVQIHPSTVSEFDIGNGPIVWVLVIPTTLDLMNDFLAKEISENDLYELTPINSKYEAIYLCSAMVLEEYRGKGLAKTLTIEAIEKIKIGHPIKSLFVWPFSSGGNALADKVAVHTCLPLKKRFN